MLGFDDGPFTPADDDVDVVGVVTRAASGYVEAVLHDHVTRDGDDATDVLAAMVQHCRQRRNIVALLTQNVMVAGFNTIDADALAAATGLPVVAVIRGREDWAAVERALVAGGVARGAAKWDRIAHCPEREVRAGKVTLVPAGLDAAAARGLAELTTVRGHMPEPLRLAHLIAAGWVTGRSKGQ